MLRKKITTLFLIVSIFTSNFPLISFASINPPQLNVYEELDDDGVKIIKADAWDNDGESGIQKIELPTGEFVYPTDNPYAINTKFYPSVTGTYTFKAYDNNNNITEKSIHVLVADILPSINVYSKGYDERTNTEIIQIDTWVESGGANLSKLELPDGSFVNVDPSSPHTINYTYKATTSGLKTFKIYDVVGRYSVKSISTKVDELNPNLEVYLSNSYKYNGLTSIKIDAWDAGYESGIKRVETSDGKTFTIANNDQYSISEEYIPTSEGSYTIKAYDRAGRFTEKTINFESNITQPNVDARVTKNAEDSYILEFEAWTDNNVPLEMFKLPNGYFLTAQSNTYRETVHFEVDGPGNYEFTAIDELGIAKTEIVTVMSDGSIKPIETDLEKATKLVELAENDPTSINIETARNTVNSLIECSQKDSLQSRLDALTNISDVSFTLKSVTANLDLYIKCENMLLMSLDTNSITFEDFSGVEDLERVNAVNISINSSLPYQLNAYLPTEIQNSDKSSTMDKRILNIKESSEVSYKEFTNTADKLVLKDNCPAGNDLVHGVDMKLKGGIAHEKDVYKTTIKFEVEQK